MDESGSRLLKPGSGSAKKPVSIRIRNKFFFIQWSRILIRVYDLAPQHCITGVWSAAIQIYEQVAASSLESSLLKYSAKAGHSTGPTSQS